MPGSQQDNDDLVPLHQPFDTALRGFHRRQVLEHLESLDGRIAMVAADRDAALAQVAELSKVLNHFRLESELLEHLRQEAERATSQVERMLESPMAEASARIQRIMRLAGEEAAELKANAEEEISAERVLAEQDAAEAIARRESEASARIRGNEMRSIVGLHLMLQAVGEQLTARASAVERDEAALRELRAQATREVTALEVLRTEVTAALATTDQLLTEAIEQVRQTMVEHPESSVHLPTQRSADGGTVYLLLNAGAGERRLPHAPS